MKPQPKPKRIKDEAYKQWIIRLPSCASGKFGYDPNTNERLNDPHHVPDGLGGSAKRNDHRLIPLTHAEHVELHNIGQETFAKKHGLDFETLIEAYRRVYERTKAEGSL